MANRNPSLSAAKETIRDSATPSPLVYNETPSPSKSRGTRTKNVILFGETGAGKSSMINLMAARDVAQTSPDAEGCTLAATEYSFTLSNPEMSLRIFDTVGLEEPEFGVNTFFGAIDKAQQLMTTVHKTGGIDLLLFCIKGGRITNATQRDYRLFFELLCEKQVPLAIVVTHLENEDVMENWWGRNKNTFRRYDIHSVAHACITTLPAHVTLYAEKRIQSRNALQKLFRDALSGSKTPYYKIVLTWITTFGQKFWSFLVNIFSFNKGDTSKRDMSKKDMAKKLEMRCGFPRDEAEGLAEIMTRHIT